MREELTQAEEKIYDLAKTLDEAQPYAYRIRGERGRYHIYRTKMYKYKTRQAEKIRAVFKTKAAAHKYMGRVEKVNEKNRQWSKEHAKAAEAKLGSTATA